MEYLKLYNRNECLDTLLDTLKDIENVLNMAYDIVKSYYGMEAGKTNVYILNDQVKFQRQKIQKYNGEKYSRHTLK